MLYGKGPTLTGGRCRSISVVVNSRLAKDLQLMRYFMIVLSIVISSVPTISAADEFLDLGKGLFFEHCTRCHGVDATGNGPDATD
ncbi:c-type cytochrome [Ruegeria sp. Alg231-54]|uniref:c-type cytochrome n=1 Tax=Ruegeria sp. Alg231-54 TaxID=1922221 RepID=UPI00359490D1